MNLALVGLFWYAAGASIQIVLFAIVAIELKRKAPSSHTFPEIIYARFGKRTHKIFLFFAFATNTIIMSMLILGGAAVVNALTGVNITLAAFLIPLRGNNLYNFWRFESNIFCRLSKHSFYFFNSTNLCSRYLFHESRNRRN